MLDRPESIRQQLIPSYFPFLFPPNGSCLHLRSIERLDHRIYHSSASSLDILLFLGILISSCCHRRGSGLVQLITHYSAHYSQFTIHNSIHTPFGVWTFIEIAVGGFQNLFTSLSLFACFPLLLSLLL